VEELDEIKETIREHRADQAREQAKRHDVKIVEEEFVLGDRVMLTTRFMKAFDGKLQDLWIGPFTVVEVYPHHQYGLELPEQYRRMHPVFDGAYLKRYKGEAQNLHPLPMLAQPEVAVKPESGREGKRETSVERGAPGGSAPSSASGPPRAPRAPRKPRDQNEYEVESIQDIKVEKAKALKFLVRWKGYSADEDTWEPQANLVNSSEIVRKFLADLEPSKRSTVQHLVKDPFRPLMWEQDAARLSLRSVIGTCKALVTDLGVCAALRFRQGCWHGWSCRVPEGLRPL